MLLPQQTLLMISACGAILAIYFSRYADGVVRPRPFIAADQIHVILAALGHTTAVVAYVLHPWWYKITTAE
jgi:hypothetical protein